MEENNMFEFILTILSYLLFSSLFICGFYKLTRHQVIVNPDGSQRIDGYILKWWSQFWEHQEGVKAWQYCGDQLESKYNILKAANLKLCLKLQISPERMSLSLNGSNLSKEDRTFIEDYLQVRVFVNADAVFLFLDEPKYTVPYFARMMYSACHICMASPASLGGMMYFAYLHFNPTAFEWASSPILAAILTIIPFCTALSFLNYLIGRKVEL